MSPAEEARRQRSAGWWDRAYKHNSASKDLPCSLTGDIKLYLTIDTIFSVHTIKSNFFFRSFAIQTMKTKRPSEARLGRCCECSSITLERTTPIMQRREAQALWDEESKSLDFLARPLVATL